MRDVSVCIPCYNEGPYVEAAVRSIVRQTAYDRIREIIVVDDGSTDDTRQRIQGLRDAGIALTYIATSNAGPSTARNRALKEANGEFIAFLDGDDLWSPDKTERQLAAFDHPDVGLVYSDYIDFEDASLDDGILVCVRRLDKHGQALVADFYLNDGPIFPSAAILRYGIYDRIGGFDERFRMVEDGCAWRSPAIDFAMSRAGSSLKRRHEGNLTHDLERWLGVFEEQTSAYAAIHRSSPLWPSDGFPDATLGSANPCSQSVASRTAHPGLSPARGARGYWARHVLSDHERTRHGHRAPGPP
jgi:glycosyltransferase involved in cell wall biosynthesis